LGKIRHLPGGGLLFAIIPLLILGYFGWYYYGAEHLDRTLFALREDNIELTPQPKWIHGDIRAEVFRDGALGQVSLLEPQATATIAHAFDEHTWIKSTNRVRKMSGGRVQVDVVYRKPAAMVYYRPTALVGSPSTAANSKGMCFPVDDEGVVLPSADFASAQVHDYFMIFAPNAAPAGDVGVSFGDERIVEALKLCRLLEPMRAELKLECVYVEPDTFDKQLGGFNSWVLNISTGDKRNVVWGHAPGKEMQDEPPVEEKIERMRSWLAAAPSATDVATLDLRQRKNVGRRLTSALESLK
jgi:hypothetical protein